MILLEMWRQGGRRACDLVLRPSMQLGSEWQQQLLLPPIALGRVSGRAHRFLSRHITSLLALAELGPEIALDGLALKIALLPPEQLLHYLRHVGAVLAGHEARQAISRSDVAAYRLALGANLFDFAVHRAPLLASAPLLPSLVHGPDNILAAVEAAGYQALQSICSGAQGALWRRIVLKLPASQAAVAMAPAIAITELRSIAQRVMRETGSS